MAWGCDMGGSDWVLRNSSSPERLWQALNRLPEAVVTDPNPTEFKMHLDNALRYHLNFERSFVEQEFGLDDSCGTLPTQDIL